MWIPISIRHDAGFLRMTERPLTEHVANKLNDLEKQYGKDIDWVHVLQHEEDKFAELLVQIKGGSNGL